MEDVSAEMSATLLASNLSDGATSVTQLIAEFGIGAVLLAAMAFLIWKLVQTWQQGLLLEVARLRGDLTERDAKIADLEAKTVLRMQLLEAKIQAASDALDAEVTGRRRAEREIARLQLAIMRELPSNGEADAIIGNVQEPHVPAP